MLVHRHPVYSHYVAPCQPYNPYSQPAITDGSYVVLATIPHSHSVVKGYQGTVPDCGAGTRATSALTSAQEVGFMVLMRKTR